MSLTFFAAGVPRPQGSKRGLVVSGRVRLVEMSKGLKPWREAVYVRAVQAIRLRGSVSVFHGPVSVVLEFVMPRPKRPTKPACDTSPDLDKLCRAVFDGLTGAALKDDSQVVRLVASKRYARPGGLEHPGCSISIEAFSRE